MHLLAMALAAAVAMPICEVAHAEPIERWRITVKDGDTIRLHGETINTRLIGFDTPETGPPDLRCDQEKVLGERARRRLVELLDVGEIDIEYFGADRYDR